MSIILGIKPFLLSLIIFLTSIKRISHVLNISQCSSFCVLHNFFFLLLFSIPISFYFYMCDLVVSPLHLYGWQQMIKLFRVSIQLDNVMRFKKTEYKLCIWVMLQTVIKYSWIFFVSLSDIIVVGCNEP